MPKHSQEGSVPAFEQKLSFLSIGSRTYQRLTCCSVPFFEDLSAIGMVVSAESLEMNMVITFSGPVATFGVQIVT